MSKTEILNVNVPGRTTRVDTDKYEAMRAAILEVTPVESTEESDGAEASLRCDSPAATIQAHTRLSCKRVAIRNSLGVLFAKRYKRRFQVILVQRRRLPSLA